MNRLQKISLELQANRVSKKEQKDSKSQTNTQLRINPSKQVTQEQQQKKLSELKNENEEELFRYQNYSFRKLTSNKKEQCLKFISQFQQPLRTSYKKQFPQEIQAVENMIKQILVQLFQNFAQNNLSIYITDLSTNQIIGISLAKDFTFQLNNFSQRFLKNRNFLSSDCKLFQQMISTIKPQLQMLLDQKGKVVDLYGGAVKKQHFGKKLTHKGLLANQMLAKKQGFQYGFCFSTNFKSAMALETLRYEKVAQIQCDEFQFDGCKPFSMIDKLHRRPSMWMRKF